VTSPHDALGTFAGAASPVTAEACAAAGVDWLVLDLEHGSGGEGQVRDVIPAAGAYGVPTVVRVESAARIRIGRVLDLGAAGVMLPRMDSAEEVRQAVRHLRYPPAGDREVATYNRACRFGLDPGALARADAEVLGVVQVESASAVGQVDQIAAIDGVDVLFVGPQDLSADGWTFVAIGSDTSLLAAAVAGELGRARQHSETRGGRT
jgi:4-hydroxy-2-oxoheptanedioate aldolase